MTYIYVIAITDGVVSLLLLSGFAYFILKWDANFYIFFNKDLLDKFFDFCREYQQEISPQKMAEILREYADRLDEW